MWARLRDSDILMRMRHQEAFLTSNAMAASLWHPWSWHRALSSWGLHYQVPRWWTPGSPFLFFLVSSLHCQEHSPSPCLPASWPRWCRGPPRSVHISYQDLPAHLQDDVPVLRQKSTAFPSFFTFSGIEDLHFFISLNTWWHHQRQPRRRASFWKGKRDMDRCRRTKLRDAVSDRIWLQYHLKIFIFYFLRL